MTTTVDRTSPRSGRPRDPWATPFPTLDGYRAIASFAVLLTHVAFNTAAVVSPVVGPPLARLDIGVTLFFLLSGFLLYRPWARAGLTGGPGRSTRGYLLRRAARVLPAYWLVVVITLSLLPEARPDGPSTWLQHVFLVQIYAGTLGAEGLTQTWSLATEVAFYLVLPLVALAAIGRDRRRTPDPDRSLRRQFAVLAALVAIGLAWRVWLAFGSGASIPASATWLPGFLDWFAIGMGLALVHERLRLPDPPAWMVALRRMADDVGSCLVIAAAGFVVLCTPVGGPVLLVAAGPWEQLFKHVGYLVVAAAFLLPGVLGGRDPGGPGRWRSALASPVMRFLGRISYGVFLWHLVVLRALTSWLGIETFTGGTWLLLPATAAVSVVLATASWHLLENPILRWAHRRTPDG